MDVMKACGATDLRLDLSTATVHRHDSRPSTSAIILVASKSTTTSAGTTIPPNIQQHDSIYQVTSKSSNLFRYTFASPRWAGDTNMTAMSRQDLHEIPTVAKHIIEYVRLKFAMPDPRKSVVLDVIRKPWRKTTPTKMRS